MTLTMREPAMIVRTKLLISRFATCVAVFLALQATATAAVTIEFWHPWKHAERIVNTLAAQYTRETGVRVRVRAFTPTSYSPWKSNSPDIVGLSRPNKAQVQQLMSAGRAYDLESDMGRGWYARFWPGALETFRISRGTRDGVYGVPLTYQVHMFVYNKSLFAKAGIRSTPRTWSELMQASRRLQRIGVVPYAGGFGSDRPPLAYAYEWSYLGLHNLTQTYFGRRPYTSTEWIRALNLYPEMRNYGFTNQDWASMSEAAAAKALIDGRVAMVFAGPGFESIRSAHKPGFNDWGVFGIPVDSRARFLPRLPGGPVEGLVISRRSLRKQEAVKFAKWLTEPRQMILFANGASAIPATPDASANPRLRSHLKVFSSGMRDQAIDMRVYERPLALKTLYSGVRGMLSGSGSPKAVAGAAERTKRR